MNESRQVCVCEVPKNAREAILFRLGELRGHRFCDIRIFITEPNADGRKEIPTKKGLAISPHLWPQFREALAQVEEAMFAAGWLDPEDLEACKDRPLFSAPLAQPPEA